MNRLEASIVLALVGVAGVFLFAPSEEPGRTIESIDPDGYQLLAKTLSERGTLGNDPDRPTAFRPPAFPSALSFVGSTRWGLVNATSWATAIVLVGVVAGGPFGPRWSWGAATAVATSPLLLRYGGLPMTEVLSACLAAGLLVAGIRARSGRGDRVGSFGLGALLGLAILTRPVFAAFGLLWGGWVLGRWWVTRRAAYRRRLNGAAAFLLGLTVVWSPWIVRNAVVFDAFIPFTTHGGYTLLLGNNPVFWDEVARVSPFATWEGDSLDRWQRSVNAEMAAAGIDGEVARDAYQRRKALGHIAERPVDFLRGVGVRVVRFWSPVPLNYGGPAVLWWAVGVYETAFLTLAAVGFVVAVRTRPPDLWVPAVLMIAAFQGVHLFYWANARMRAPLVPVLAIFAAVGLREAWLVFKPMIRKHLGRSSAGEAA